jgi:molecular chaperone DnaJ
VEAAKGVSKSITTLPLVTCTTCSGNGLKKGTKRSACKSCNGTGTRVHFMAGGFQMASTCNTCGGSGTAIPRGSECGTCSGDGVVRERKTLNVEIPGGVEDGMRLRVSGEGDAPPTGRVASANVRGVNGDLYVLVKVARDAQFSRQGSDILYTSTIPLTTAILGGEVVIPTLDGDARVRVATGTSTGDKMTLAGKGMPKLGGGGGLRRSRTGDLKVEFKVAMPKYLSSNQRALVEMLADELGDKTAKRVMNLHRS